MDTRELIERLRYRVNNPSAWDSFEQARSDLCADASAALSSQAAEIERLREALAGMDELIERNIHDNGSETNRMRLDGEWHEGPVVDALFRILRGVQDIARAALTPKPNKEA